MAVLVRGVNLVSYSFSKVVSELEWRRCNFSGAPSRKIRIAERELIKLSRKDTINGPGKLCRYFQIDKNLNAEDITTSSQLWIEDRGVAIDSHHLKTGPRINIDYAGEYKHKPWRFFIDL